MNIHDAASPKPRLVTLTVRSAAFFGLWLVMIGTAPAHWPFGLVAAAAATWASVALWPASSPVSMTGLLRFVIRFVPQSVIAGLDIARRAMAPKVLLQPGVVAFAPAVQDGFRLGALRAVMSLQPGKLPAGSGEAGGILVHCLDVEAPVSTEMADDERAFLQIWHEGQSLG